MYEDYSTARGTLAPWWRRDTKAHPEGSRIAAKQRSQHLLVLPEGSISIALAADAEEPAWLMPSLEALHEIGFLPENWNSYGSRAVSIHALAATIRLLGALMNEAMPLPAFVPTRRGGVQIEWHIKGIDLEIEVTPAERIHASFEDLETGREWENDVTSDLSLVRQELTGLPG
ncbi:MAG: hypothetical protein Q8Q14_09835 [Gemmatimonadales bacterium]|nr:hypothetical protein [Gemmatimonadales bacterium]